MGRQPVIPSYHFLLLKDSGTQYISFPQTLNICVDVKSCIEKLEMELEEEMKKEEEKKQMNAEVTTAVTAAAAGDSESKEEKEDQEQICADSPIQNGKGKMTLCIFYISYAL